MQLSRGSWWPVKPAGLSPAGLSQVEGETTEREAHIWGQQEGEAVGSRIRCPCIRPR